MRSVFIGALLIALLAPPDAAGGVLIGDSVGCSTDGGPFSLACSSPTATVVDPGVEFTFDDTFPFFPGPFLDVDLRASSIFIGSNPRVTAATLLVPVSLTLDDLDFGPAETIIGFVLTNTGVTGLDASDITFGPHSVTINLLDTIWSNSEGDSATIALTTNRPPPVPEPASLLLLCAGIGALAARGRQTGRS